MAIRVLNVSYEAVREIEKEIIAEQVRLDRARRELGAALRQWREAHGLSLRAYAKRKGVSAAYVSDAERGRRNPVHLLPMAND